MLTVKFLIFFIACWICVECMDVIPERIEVVYLNPKYMYTNGTANVRRYSRRSRYYVNLDGTNKQAFTNNVTVTVSVSQFLHNEYRRSFVSFSYKYCDLINNEPYIGGALKKSGIFCPLPAGHHIVANLTGQTENFPNVFPFEKGRLEFVISVTENKETIFELNIYALFKQKI